MENQNPVITGKEIFEEIMQLQKEMEEIDEAIETLMIKLGTNNAAYQTLKKSWEEKKERKEYLENIEYRVSNQGTSI